MNDKQQLMALGEEMAERRIAACLSACEGFDDPVDEVGQIRRYIPLLTDRMLSAERQRDELLAALEALVKIVADTPRPDPDDVFATIYEARSVIRHCEE